MKVKIFADGNFMTVKSANKLEDIAALRKSSPEHLVLTNPDTGETVYSAAIAKSGDGKINQIGVEFSPDADPTGYAKVVVPLPACDDLKEYVAENFTVALERLERLDKFITVGLDTLKDKRERIASLIQIVE